MLKRLVCIIIFCTFASSIEETASVIRLAWMTESWLRKAEANQKKARKVFERHVRIKTLIINQLNFNNLTYGEDFLWTETEQEWEVEDFW